MAESRAVSFREARPADGRTLFAMVEAVGTLERNTGYAYVVYCDHFRATTLIAERDGSPVGFVLAHRPPTHPDTVFVWQVGVLPAGRGLGVAGGLLDALAGRSRGVRFLEATVTPTNEASRRLFESFARRRGAPVAWTDGYPSTFFHGSHEPERLVRIGPFEGPGESV
ncbi:MAG: diaminobutyrate acetyltransferase [Myxococcales bacterium]|nr:diaminobutyrate acetyltransferase [Myxococcales bacterium]